MVCDITFSIETFADLLVWPTQCDFYFYVKFFLALFIILTWTLYKKEKKLRQDAEFISCLGVSSLAVLVLSLIGTLIQNSEGLPMVSSPVLLYILAMTIPIVIIWIFKR